MQQSEAGLLADESFSRTLAAVEKRLPLLDRLPRVRVKAWLVKLNESTSNITWKRNRNLYARLLLEQLRAGVLEVPFHGLPPQGALPTLPAFLTYRFLPPPGSERQFSGAEAGPSGAPPEPIWITPGRYASQHQQQQQQQHHQQQQQRSLSAGHTRGQQPRSPQQQGGSRELRGSGSIAAPGTPPGALPAGSSPMLAGTWGGAWETSPAAAAATACAAAAAAAAARRCNAHRAWPGFVPAPAHGLRSSSSGCMGPGKQTASAQQQLFGSLAAGGDPGACSPVEAFVDAAAAVSACYPEGVDSPSCSQRLEARLHYAEAKLFEQELELQRLHSATAAAKRQLKAATRACLDDLLTRYGTSSSSGGGGAGGGGWEGHGTWMSPWSRAGAEAAGAAGGGAAAAAAAGPSTQHLPSAVEEALEPFYDLVSTVDRVFAGVTRWPGAGYTQEWPPSPGRGRPGPQQQQQQQQQQRSQQQQSQRLASSSRHRSVGQQKGHGTAAAAGARGGGVGDHGAGWDSHQPSGHYDDMEEGEGEEGGQLLAAEASQDSLISGGPDRGDLGAGLTPEASSEAVGAAAGPLQHGLGPLAAAQLADAEVEMAEDMDLMLQTFRSMLLTCGEQQETTYKVLSSHLEEALASSSSSRKAARKLSSGAAAAVQPLRQLLTMYRRHCVRLQDQAYASAATAAASAAAAGEAGHDTGSLMAETSQPDVTSPRGGGHPQQQQTGKRGRRQQQEGEEHAAGVTRSQQMHAQLQQLLTDFASHIAVVEQQLQVYADRALESAAAAAKGRSSGGAQATSSSKKHGTGGSSSSGTALCEGAQDWAAKMMGVLEAFEESLQQLQERADVLHWRQQQERLHDMQQRQQRVRSLERCNSVNATVGSCYSRTSIGVREPLSAAEAAAARASAAADAKAALGEASDDEPEQEEILPPPLWQLIADTQPKGIKDGSQFGNIVDYILSNSPRTGAPAAGAGGSTSVAAPRAGDDASNHKSAKVAAAALLGGGSAQSTVPNSPRHHTASPLGLAAGGGMGRSGSGPVGPSAAVPPAPSTNNAMADRVASLSQQASKLLDKSSSLLGGPAGGTGPTAGLSGALGRMAGGSTTSMGGAALGPGAGLSSGGALLGGGAKPGGTGVSLSATMASAWGSTSKGPLAGPTGGSNSSSLLRKSGEGLLGGGLGSGLSMGGALMGGGGGASGLGMGGGAFAGATGGSSSSSLLKPNPLGTSFGGASIGSGFSSAGRLW